MNEEQCQFSDIAQSLQVILQHHPTPQSLKNKHFLNELRVAFFIKKPATHTYICDNKVSIQVQFKTQKSKPLEEYVLDPFNKIVNHYYAVTYDNDKYLYTLNCNDRTLYDKYEIKVKSSKRISQSDTYMVDQNLMYQQLEQPCPLLSNIDQNYEATPYEPLFFFDKSVFEQFLKSRDNLKIQDPLDKITILDWVLKVVNVSKTGSYAFIIEIYKFQFQKQKVWAGGNSETKQANQSNLDLKNIGSILYQSRFQYLLEKMRLKHIKQLFTGQDEDEQQDIGMCYHLRNLQISHKLPKVSQFVALDKQGEVLNFSKQFPVHFIPIGQLDGVCTFPTSVSLNKQQKQQQSKQLNSFSMKGLYQILNKNYINRNKKREQKHKYQMHRKLKENNLTKMVQETIQNSYDRIGQRKRRLEPELWQEDSLWSDSDAKGSNEEQEEVNEGMKNKSNQYANILNENSSSQSSSDEQQNEYFRKYRQEMRKQGMV